MQKALGHGGTSIICTRRCKPTERLSESEAPNFDSRGDKTQMASPSWHTLQTPLSTLNTSVSYLLVQELGLRGGGERDVRLSRSSLANQIVPAQNSLLIRNEVNRVGPPSCGPAQRQARRHCLIICCILVVKQGSLLLSPG